jgi:hypothetical protein
VERVGDIGPALVKGLALAREGALCVIDARVAPGYDADMSGAPAAQRR